MQLQMANQFLNMGRLAESEVLFKQFLESNPGHLQASYSLGCLYLSQEKFVEALGYLEAVLEKDSCHQNALLNLYSIYLKIGANEMAEGVMRRLISIRPSDCGLYFQLGQLLTSMNRLEDSVEVYQKGISVSSCFPDIDKVYAHLAGLQKDLGRFDEAEINYKKALKENKLFPEAHRCLSQLHTYTTRSEQVIQMEDSLSNQNLDEAAKVHLYFGLSKAYEDFGEYDKSFGYLDQGRLSLRSANSFSLSRESEVFEQIKKGFSSELLAKYSGRGCESARPIFVLGMPRSGTTLVEQVLASHSQVYGAGELTLVQEIFDPLVGSVLSSDSPLDLPLKELGLRYLDLLPAAAKSSNFVVDKMPLNFLYIGIILLVFPNAKIVHCARDPVATCHSIFKNYFEGTHVYANSLVDLGGYYKLYQELMNHWVTLSPYSIYTVQYEELVDDFEYESSSLLKFLGLPQEKACSEFYKNSRQVKTASFKQVRTPIYKSSVAAWKNYEQHLQPLINVLKS